MYNQVQNDSIQSKITNTTEYKMTSQIKKIIAHVCQGFDFQKKLKGTNGSKR